MLSKSPRTIYEVAALGMAAFVLFSVLAQNAYGEQMSSSNYKMQSDSVNFGGGLSNSDAYIMESTFGEVATGISSSTSYVMKAGYQQMHEVTIAVTPAADVEMLPVIGGVTGGTSNGSTNFSVRTDGAAGYTVTIASASSPALASALDSFDDYAPSGVVPDFTFTNANNSSSFAFTPEGTDISSMYKDDSADCGTGISDAADSCWDGLSTTPKNIVTRTTANHPSGTQTTLKFRAASGSNNIQIDGTYTATAILTIVAL